MPELVTWAWGLILEVWGWLVGVGGWLAAVGIWLRWGRKNQQSDAGIVPSGLSVVRAIAGPSVQDFGLALSDRVKAWRLNNLISISERFDRLCKEKKLASAELRSLSMAVGLPMLEQASNVEEGELQELWANLMVSATTNAEESDDSQDLYKTWTNILATMSIWDCKLFSTVVEKGISGRRDDGVIISNPLTLDDVREAAEMERVRVDIHLEKLVSLGLVYRDIKTPLTPGGPGGLEYGYFPTLMGMNMYVVCGNTPQWMEVVSMAPRYWVTGAARSCTTDVMTGGSK